MTSADDRRRELLQRTTLLIGEDWAKTWLADMRRERRVVGGGWPGTLPEARARVNALLTAELERRRMLPLSAEELAAATQRVYQQAKREWLDAADRFAEPRARRPRATRPDPDHR
jgi:hypothetical protein